MKFIPKIEILINFTACPGKYSDFSCRFCRVSM
nr:MAG TPA: Thioredoxin [Bacteriophage sp.]